MPDAHALVQVEVEGYLDKFLSIATNGEDEKAMYQPFANLVNSIVSLVTDPEIFYIKTDRFPLGGAVSNARRKYDALVIICFPKFISLTQARWDFCT